MSPDLMILGIAVYFGLYKYVPKMRCEKK